VFRFCDATYLVTLLDLVNVVIPCLNLLPYIKLGDIRIHNYLTSSAFVRIIGVRYMMKNWRQNIKPWRTLYLKIKIKNATDPVLTHRRSNWQYLRDNKFIALSLTPFQIRLIIFMWSILLLLKTKYNAVGSVRIAEKYFRRNS